MRRARARRVFHVARTGGHLVSAKISKDRRAHLMRALTPRFRFVDGTDFHVDVFIGGVRVPTIRASYDEGPHPATRGTYTIDCRPIAFVFRSQLPPVATS